MNDHTMTVGERRYDAFISYSHATDSQRARQLQNALQRIATPWYRRRGMRVFRDETDLSATPEGWPLIQAALADSRYLILLASKNAATSEWVSREVSYWLERRSTEEVLIALTDGELVWDDEELDFDWSRTTALPRTFTKRFDHEPFWVDMRGLDCAQSVTHKHPDLLQAVAKLAAPIKGFEVDKLVNEVHRQYRRKVQAGSGIGMILLASLAVAAWQFQARLAAAERERDERVLSSIARAYQVLHQNPLQALDAAHQALETKATSEGRVALRTALEVAVNRRESREEEAAVLGSGVGYLMERWREGDVFAKLRRDGRYLLVASERGKDGPSPPGTVFLIDMDNLRTRELHPGDDARGRRLEYMGFSNSGEDIFVARQFYLDIFDLDGGLKQSVQLEYHAKPTHLIAGMFGSYVLVGDAVGHLMLADTASSERPQLEGARYPVATLFIEANEDATCAIVVFESGRADFIDLADPTAAKQYRVVDDSVAFATFSQTPGSTRFITASETGEVVIWNYQGGDVVRVTSFVHGRNPVGLATFSEDEARAITLSDEGTVSLWEADTGELIVSYSRGVVTP